jgi:hypothetical protein
VARTDTIPFARDDFRGTAQIVWDLVITKLTGLDRWRFLVIVDHLRTSDGRFVPSRQINVFVLPKPFGLFSAGDARTSFVSSTPLQASQVEVEAVRAVEQISGDVSVFFSAFSTDKVPKGVTRAALIPHPTISRRMVASEDVQDP